MREERTTIPRCQVFLHLSVSFLDKVSPNGGNTQASTRPRKPPSLPPHARAASAHQTSCLAAVVRATSLHPSASEAARTGLGRCCARSHRVARSAETPVKRL